MVFTRILIDDKLNGKFHLWDILLFTQTGQCGCLASEISLPLSKNKMNSSVKDSYILF